MTKVIKLILTDDRRGLGKDGDPVRKVRQLFDLDGELVAEEGTEWDEGFFDPNKIKEKHSA